ncbi:MAG: PDDEXK nuclease domain-containing protein [Gammaproteobacteria bacterium]
MSKQLKENKDTLHLDNEYLAFVSSIKSRLKTAQLRAASAVNTEVLGFYWGLGKDILDMQASKKHWGTKFLDQLSHDLQTANPEMSGLSKRSLEYMRLLATVYPEQQQFTQQPAAQLPWSHIQLLLDKFKNDASQREWYAKEAITNGWSRPTLNTHIKSDLYERQAIDGVKVSNYQKLLPSPQSDLAHDMLKNPYNFDFLTISKEAHERDIENGLVNHIRNFLLELGAGFAFVGTQVPLVVDGEEYFIDVLFYHLKLRCYVVIELKAKKFKPADLGQLSFYLTAVNEQLCHPQDNPTIGILLCESRSKIVAEYALRQISAPIGVSEYTLSRALPKEFKSSLPTIEEIEIGLNQVNDVESNNKS